MLKFAAYLGVINFAMLGHDACLETSHRVGGRLSAGCRSGAAWCAPTFNISIILNCVVRMLAAFSKAKSIASSGKGSTPADSAGPLGMVVGSRAHLEKAAVAKRNGVRNFLMHGFHMLVMFVAGGKVRQQPGGTRLPCCLPVFPGPPSACFHVYMLSKQ